MHKVWAMENGDASLWELGIVALLWTAWCSLHSLLISHAVMAAVERRFGRHIVWYRVGYNLFALLSIIPVLYFTYKAGGVVLLSWQGWTIALRVGLLLLALILFHGGATRYDLQTFLGVRQVREKHLRLLLSDSTDFVRDGVFGVTRHPWYLGSLFFIWSVFCCYSTAMLCAVIVLSIYLVAGAKLEERKILAQFPEAYSSYQQDVSMLFPWKWLSRKVLRRD